MTSQAFCSQTVTLFGGASSPQKITITSAAPSVDRGMTLKGQKRRRVSAKDDIDEAIITPLSLSPNPSLLCVPRPSRAASSSPQDCLRTKAHSESNLVHLASQSRLSLHCGEKASSMGLHPRRFMSPSDSRRARTDFCKQALLNDAAISRSQFLSGQWLMNVQLASKLKSDDRNMEPDEINPLLGNSYVCKTTSKRKMLAEPMEMMAALPTAYYMGDVNDPRDECRQTPNRDATDEELTNVLVERRHVDMNGNWEAELDHLIDVYQMKARDQVCINRNTMPEFEKKLAIFFEEHMHKDPELRFIREGRGYFDVRGTKQDEWIRIPVECGDFVFLPAGIYHRFSPDQNENVVAIRLFATEPRWTAYNRSENGDEQEERDEYLKLIGAVAAN